MPPSRAACSDWLSAPLTSRRPAVDLPLSPRLRGERLNHGLLHLGTDGASAAERERARERQSELVEERQSGRRGAAFGSSLDAAAGTANAASGTMETKPLTNGNNGGYDVAGECVRVRSCVCVWTLLEITGILDKVRTNFTCLYFMVNFAACNLL